MRESPLPVSLCRVEPTASLVDSMVRHRYPPIEHGEKSGGGAENFRRGIVRLFLSDFYTEKSSKVRVKQQNSRSVLRGAYVASMAPLGQRRDQVFAPLLVR